VVSAHVSLSRRQRAQHLLLVLGLALAAAVAAAIFAEGRYARVLCDGYGRERQLTYVAFRYPPANPLSLLRADNSSRCVFVDGSAVVGVDFRQVAPNPLTYWLVTLATLRIRSVRVATARSLAQWLQDATAFIQC
jgi:hypothetical protein